MPHPITPQLPPWTGWIQDTRKDPYFHIVCCTVQIRTPVSEFQDRNSVDLGIFFLSSIVQLWWAGVSCRSVSCFWLTGVAPHVVFAAVTKTCCAFADVLLPTLGIYFKLLLPSYELKGHSPLASNTNKAFFTKRTAIYFVFHLPLTILCKPWRRLCGKIPAIYEILKPSSLAKINFHLCERLSKCK